MSGAWCRLAVAGFALAALVAGGCDSAQVVADAVLGRGEQVKRLYTLERKKTLVLVDTIDDGGRANILAAPALRNTIASDIAFYIQKEEALEEGQFVPLRDLLKLANELGEGYAVTPIDQIGRRLGAGQVIHVVVESATLQIVGSLYRPIAEGQVKVIDVEAGRRVFPQSIGLSMQDAAVPGHRFRVEVDPSSVEASSRTSVDLQARLLAEKTGLEVSQVFYDWRKPEFGSKFN